MDYLRRPEIAAINRRATAHLRFISSSRDRTTKEHDGYESNGTLQIRRFIEGNA